MKYHFTGISSYKVGGCFVKLFVFFWVIYKISPVFCLYFENIHITSCRMLSYIHVIWVFNFVGIQFLQYFTAKIPILLWCSWLHYLFSPMTYILNFRAHVIASYHLRKQQQIVSESCIFAKMTTILKDLRYSLTIAVNVFALLCP